MTVLTDTRERTGPRPGPRIALRPAGSPQVWRIDPARAAVCVRAPHTPWSVRLGAYGGRLHLDPGAGTLRLAAVLSPDALSAALPLTRMLFLPGVATTTRLMLLAEGAAGAGPVAARIWAGTLVWPTELDIVLRRLTDDQAVLEVAGEIRCRTYTWLNGTRLRVEGAAEVLRCG